MANFNDGRYLSRLAGADLTGKQFYIVKQQSDRTVVLASAATDDLFGVLDNGVSSGDVASVCGRNASGTFKVVAGGNVAVGDRLTSDVNGKAVATTTTGNQVIGVCQEAGVNGQIVEYLPVNYKY